VNFDLWLFSSYDSVILIYEIRPLYQLQHILSRANKDWLADPQRNDPVMRGRRPRELRSEVGSSHKNKIL